MTKRAALCLIPLLLAAPAAARDSLGIYANWGAFRDPAVPRCYAVAKAEPSSRQRALEPYADVGTWPKRGLRGQVHFRLSQAIAAGSRVTLSLGGQRFELSAGGGDAWSADKRMDAAVVALMRSTSGMTVSARDSYGRPFSNFYRLEGAASAMDAAALGCARAVRNLG